MFSSQERHKLITDIYKNTPQVKIDPREIYNGKMIPTYNLMKDLQKENPEKEFHFLIGSDLI